MRIKKNFLLEKFTLRENRMAVTAAAAGLAGGASALPPAEDMPYLDEILFAVGRAEHRNRTEGSPLDYNSKLYVRTGGKDPILNKGKEGKEVKHSSAYGPFQFTGQTVRDLSSRHKELFAGTEDYVGQFLDQSSKMLNSTKRAEAEIAANRTPEPDEVYGYGKSGVLSGEEYHEQYMNMSRAGLAAMAKDMKIDIKNMTPQEEARLLKRFRGVSPEGSYAKAYASGREEYRRQQEEKKKSDAARSEGPQDSVTPAEKSVTTPEKPVTTPEKPTSTPRVHTVIPGDNLSKIAAKYKKTLQQILDANPGIKNPDRIDPKQNINIPD